MKTKIVNQFYQLIKEGEFVDMNIFKEIWDNIETDKKELKRSKKLIISSIIYAMIIMLTFSGLCLIFPNGVNNMSIGGFFQVFLLCSFVVMIVREVFWYTNVKIKICGVLIVIIISSILAYRKDGYFINISTFIANSVIIFMVLTIIERTRQYATDIIKFLTRKSKK